MTEKLLQKEDSVRKILDENRLDYNDLKKKTGFKHRTLRKIIQRLLKKKEIRICSERRYTHNNEI
jgi:hypothetical protein